jgi:SP family general alpha glucoside:H+ symporter-like MFS transporter
MDPTTWNRESKTAFFWAASGILTNTWTPFRLPEAKDRTFAGLDVMFLRKIPARKFAGENMED